MYVDIIHIDFTTRTASSCLIYALILYDHSHRRGSLFIDTFVLIRNHCIHDHSNSEDCK